MTSAATDAAATSSNAERQTVDWTLSTWIVVAAAAGFTFLVVQVVWLGAVLHWEDRATEGLGYWGRSPEGRRRFRQSLERHSRLLRPVLAFLGRTASFRFERVSFDFEGIAGPEGTCDSDSFAGGAAYGPDPEDVFVVTQMRCGTTWMQHVVYETLHRGAGDLVDSGTALHAVSPWLESRKTVPVEEAPLLGQVRPSRLIKTHFPASLCPFDTEARYVYVTRHPVSCFASCVDFVSANAGAMAPPAEVVAEWFCSEDMWWGPWPDHVDGWWTRARQAENVLFVHFEEMKSDLGEVVARVAEFLGLEPLKGDEMRRVVERCSYDYMEGHAEAFEMQPPNILSVHADLFRRGTADRHRDVEAETRRRVARWCAERMADSAYPLGEVYPDVTGGVSGPSPESDSPPRVD